MHTILTRLALVGTLLAASCGPSDFCERQAMGDRCIEQACMECADMCGGSCDVLESNPPVFDCEDATVSVHDVCDDWTPAE